MASAVSGLLYIENWGELAHYLNLNTTMVLNVMDVGTLTTFPVPVASPPLHPDTFTRGGLKGHDIDNTEANDYNSAFVTVNPGSTTTGLWNWDEMGLGNSGSAAINKIFLNRFAPPWGGATFRQIRVGENPLAVYYRRNNLYTHTPDGGDPIVVKTAAGSITVQERRGASLIASQSVATNRYQPIVHALNVRAGTTDDDQEILTPVVLETSFANSLVSFDNVEFANKLNIGINITDSPYKQIRKMYSRGALKDPNSPIAGVNRIIYRETVWPSLSNAYTSAVRGRTKYTNNFWRTERADRSVTIATNSAGQEITTPSKWALDSPDGIGNFTSAATGGIDDSALTALSGTRGGELQNTYSHFLSPSRDGSLSGSHSGDDMDGLNKFRRPGVLYARKHIFPFANSVAIIGGGVGFGDITIEKRSPASANWLMPSASTGTGEAFWQASADAGRYVIDTDTGNVVFAQTGSDPFYDSYEEYFADVKPQGQSFSIIPEFRITDHLDFINANGGDALAPNLKQFQIVGVPDATTTLGYASSKQRVLPQNSNEADFFKIFTNSDFMKYFEIVRKDHRNLVKPTSIQLKCKAIKKFLPYDGFFPAERTVEIAAAFSSSYGDLIQYTGADEGLECRYNVFIKPLFAPGILYNTIKGGLAVDYPVMTGSYLVDHATEGVAAISEAIAAVHTSSAQISSNSTYYSQHATTADVGGHGSSVYGFHGRSHNDGWDKRIPFEALVDPEKYMSNINIVHDEPSMYCNIRATASWGGTSNSNKYRNMMHNFLAESINFFLRSGRTTELLSKPASEWEPVSPGQPYGMRVKLWRSRTLPKAVSGSWGNYPVPQHLSGDGKANFEMYSRASAFGPPVAAGTGSLNGSPFLTPAGNITGTYAPGPANGIYASHTPPYYNGESWVDIVYFPYINILSPTGSSDGGALGVATQELRTLTVRDLHALAEIKEHGTLFSSEDNQKSRYGHQGTYIVKWRFDREAFVADSSFEIDGIYQQGGLYDGTSSADGPMSGVWVNKWAMQGDASLNLFERDGARWKIATKFETPMLNFVHYNDNVAPSKVRIHGQGDIGSLSRNNTIARGMWHQFGRIPQEDEGVYLQVTDIPENWLDNHPSGNIMFDPAGRFDVENSYDSSVPSNVLRTTIASHLSGYKFPLGYYGGEDTQGNIDVTRISPKCKSLVDVCGFDTEPVKIGKLRSKKKVFEAVVAVPFIEQDGERKFFKTISPDSAVYESTAGASIKRQVRLMKKYVFPPSFDFVQNKGVVDPIAMYIFEFSHKFDENDLSYIWQNLSPPSSAHRAEFAMATVRHPLLVNELLGDPEEAIDNATAGNGPYHQRFPNKLQWMVFKVKQRAKTDYYKAISKSSEFTQIATDSPLTYTMDGDIRTDIEEESFNSSVPFYTDNWPYDHFSLVELAEIQSNITFGQTIAKPAPFVGVPPEIEQVAASPDLVDLADTSNIPGSVSGLTGRNYTDGE